MIQPEIQSSSYFQYYVLMGIALIFIVFVIFLVRYFWRQRLYFVKIPLLSPTEKHFLMTLNAINAGYFWIAPKVRVADVLHPSSNLSSDTWKKYFWKVSNKHFDFVLCDKESFEVVCVIELNDKSHNEYERIQRDELITEVCASAGLPLVWVIAKRDYDKKALTESLRHAIANPPQKRNLT